MTGLRLLYSAVLVMIHLPSDFEQTLLAHEPDYTGCREGEDFVMRIAETLPYQLGLTFEWIREHLGLRADDISIADGVALRVIVSACVLQYKRGGNWVSDTKDTWIFLLRQPSAGCTNGLMPMRLR